ncbi:MAG: YdiU family protein, partial [Conexibacter sp.]|nr:YdiU family protein [Conexibacter sp.]
MPGTSLGEMSTVARGLLHFDNSYVRELEGLYLPWQAAPAPEPRLLALNEELAAELGVEAGALRAPEGVAALVGNAVPESAEPGAMAYA